MLSVYLYKMKLLIDMFLSRTVTDTQAWLPATMKANTREAGANVKESD